MSLLWTWDEAGARNDDLGEIELIDAACKTRAVARFGVAAGTVGAIVVEWDGGTFSLVTIDGGQTFAPSLLLVEEAP